MDSLGWRRAKDYSIFTCLAADAGRVIYLFCSLASSGQVVGASDIYPCCDRIQAFYALLIMLNLRINQPFWLRILTEASCSDPSLLLPSCLAPVLLPLRTQWQHPVRLATSLSCSPTRTVSRCPMTFSCPVAATSTGKLPLPLSPRLCFFYFTRCSNVSCSFVS